MTAHADNKANAHALAQTTAHLLASARYVAAANALLFAAAIWLGGRWAVAQVLLLAVLLYLHLRMGFDRRVFADFAAHQLTPEGFDACRAALGLGRAAHAVSMPQRCAGAVKLLKQTAGFTALQCLLLLLQMASQGA